MLRVEEISIFINLPEIPNIMKKFPILIAFLLILHNVNCQDRPLTGIPDLPGYKTLVCDFHMHTVFSDGKVWPTVRVDEAWREGLDAIAITDHLEYQPHGKDMKKDYNRSWQIAREYGEKRGVIVIPGTEITKGMPPGHFNALFIKDAAPIMNADFKLAIGEAVNQGAFILWNHPGWKAQQPDTMKWWDEHTFLYEKGWMHGIEVVNDREFYPEAVNWAKAKGLAMIGNSDQHDPFLYETFEHDDHRNCTFVFATEKSIGGIREALFNGRTAAYYKHNVIGKPSILNELFLQSVSLKSGDNGKNKFALVNPTSLTFNIQIKNKIYDDQIVSFKLLPGHEYYFEFQEDTDPKQLKVEVSNFITGNGESLELDLLTMKSIED